MAALAQPLVDSLCQLAFWHVESNTLKKSRDRIYEQEELSSEIKDDIHEMEGGVRLQQLFVLLMK
ncbi:hypothetical protein [Pelagibaculum spongiae]|nr:hypothetical protein [Pelagibaculum spongiae]